MIDHVSSLSINVLLQLLFCILLTQKSSIIQNYLHAITALHKTTEFFSSVTSNSSAFSKFSEHLLFTSTSSERVWFWRSFLFKISDSLSQMLYYTVFCVKAKTLCVWSLPCLRLKLTLRDLLTAHSPTLVKFRIWKLYLW